MTDWERDGNTLKKWDYMIKNEGKKKGGDQYVLWKRCDRKRFKFCYCQLIGMGTLDEMRGKV